MLSDHIVGFFCLLVLLIQASLTLMSVSSAVLFMVNSFSVALSNPFF